MPSGEHTSGPDMSPGQGGPLYDPERRARIHEWIKTHPPKSWADTAREMWRQAIGEQDPPEQPPETLQK